MKIIATSDGRISFKAEDYESHRTGTEGGLLLKSNELCIFTKKGTAFDRGEIIQYASPEIAQKFSREITEQLSK
jgi:hypothetical protein